MSNPPSGFDEPLRRTGDVLRETEGCVSTWNLGARRIKGYEAEEILGGHFSAFYTREDVERRYPVEVLHRAVADGWYEEEALRVWTNWPP